MLPSSSPCQGREGGTGFHTSNNPEGNKGAEGEVLRYKSLYAARICLSNTFLTGILSLLSQTNGEEYGGKGVGGERAAVKDLCSMGADLA